MSKSAEIAYVLTMAEELNVPLAEVDRGLRAKPCGESRRSHYLIDMGQIFRLLPEPPGRLLDLGCGPGWTSRMLATAGYEVLGLDLCPDMIRIANESSNGLPVRFLVHDYEGPIPFGEFRIALIYDALHHAIDPAAVIRNVYSVLEPGGMFITAEPGAGHSKTEDSLRAMRRFGTTERDMPFSYQKQLLANAGFSTIDQYLRLSELPLESIASGKQNAHWGALEHNTLSEGFTSIVVARK
jgi:SAM-dependent methyltransferase